ncbi:MAG: hypothetical protein ACI8XB_003347, partial [Patiriisocius sp.]
SKVTLFCNKSVVLETEDTKESSHSRYVFIEINS